ncbi:MAG TPA: protein kinase [Methylomirabilota bacterium]
MHDRIGPYRVLGPLGEGGMGVVYEARDERLDRTVALKVIKALGDPGSRERLRREARLAAQLSHPAICHVYEIGEASNGELYLALERLQGESLAARLARGPMEPAEAVGIGLGLLAGLEAIETAGLVHRDLKPSNVFLTPHGPRLLDFGLARPVSALIGAETVQVTQQGILMGTPHYMAPEVIRGRPPDIRSDLFSLAVILYEMLAGRAPFTGETTVEVLHAVLNDTPPALGGSELIVALDRAIARALQKRPEDRYASAAEMAGALRQAARRTGPQTGIVAPARPVTRLIVLPFRMLRPDPDLDFLAYSLADAVTASLSGLRSLVVRSSATASKYAGPAPDLAAIAHHAEVDVVVTGTILAAGGQVRVSAQLTEAPGGTLLWSQTSQIGMGDLFTLQDQIVQQLVESLALPLSARERSQLHQDVPASAVAYEYYLRANQLAHDAHQWGIARELYLQCVQADPAYAPAWARLGRCSRLLGKYGRGSRAVEYLREAEEAFARALELNPDLSLAHSLSAAFDLERGRVLEALERLLRRAADRPADPQLYAGLVQACRYGGLLHASLAAHQEAVRLDPTLRTTVAHTYLALGDLARTVEHDHDDPPYLSCYAHLLSGNRVQARMVAQAAQRDTVQPHLSLVGTAALAVLDDRPQDARLALTELTQYEAFRDPEGWFYWAACFAQVGALDEAMMLLRKAQEGGYGSVGLLSVALFDPLRGRADFAALVAAVNEQRARALETYRRAGGPKVLGTDEN